MRFHVVHCENKSAELDCKVVQHFALRRCQTFLQRFALRSCLLGVCEVLAALRAARWLEISLRGCPKFSRSLERLKTALPMYDVKAKLGRREYLEFQIIEWATKLSTFNLILQHSFHLRTLFEAGGKTNYSRQESSLRWGGGLKYGHISSENSEIFLRN
jgi:hypothetical protein